MTYEESLKYAIAGEAVFLIGSGFSIGAKNNSTEDDKTLWKGKILAQKLAEKTGMDEDTTLDIVSQEYIDLFGEKKMIQYLKEHYKVASYETYYNALTKIKNLRVYSTNYDDLIEKVYEDNKNIIHGYNIHENITNANKEKMVLHLNGYINDLNDGSIPETFKLSHLSYNNTEFFDNSWYAYFNDELDSAKVIFIIGLSFKSDLDIRRIVSGANLKDKIFIIENETLSDSNRKFLEKYGRVVLCGVQTFLKNLSETDIAKEEKDYFLQFKSFKKVKKSIR